MKRREFLRLSGVAGVTVLPAGVCTGTSREEAQASEDQGAFSQESGMLEDPIAIKLFGVGGAGINAVNRLISRDVRGMDFVAVDTDTTALFGSRAQHTARLGTLDSSEKIAAALKGTDMAFIVAGLGGSTGTEAATVIAEIAEKMRIPAFAAVTTPFGFEHGRAAVAEAGLKRLREFIASPIVLTNDVSLAPASGQRSLGESPAAPFDLLADVISTIPDMLNYRHMVNADFHDLKTLLSTPGFSRISSATCVGKGRATAAAEHAMASLLPADRSMVDKGDVVIVVVGSRGLKLSEASEAVNAVGERTTENVRRIFSVLHDDRMGDALKVALLLTGQPDQVTRA